MNATLSEVQTLAEQLTTEEQSALSRHLQRLWNTKRLARVWDEKPQELKDHMTETFIRLFSSSDFSQRDKSAHYLLNHPEFPITDKQLKIGMCDSHPHVSRSFLELFLHRNPIEKFPTDVADHVFSTLSFESTNVHAEYLVKRNLGLTNQNLATLSEFLTHPSENSNVSQADQDFSKRHLLVALINNAHLPLSQAVWRKALLHSSEDVRHHAMMRQETECDAVNPVILKEVSERTPISIKKPKYRLQ
jgi:hypothetical protein